MQFCHSTNTAWLGYRRQSIGDIQSGYSVSSSANGNIIAIGAPYFDGNGSNSGNVKVYSYGGGIWTQLGADIYGQSSDDNAGWSISLSADGMKLAIGSPNDDSGANSN